MSGRRDDAILGRPVSRPRTAPERRVMFVITGLETGGAEAMLWKVLRRIDRARWVPLVVSLRSRGTFGPRIEALGVRVIPLGTRHPLQSPRAVAALRRLVREFEPHLLQGWMYHGNLAALAARGAVTPPAPVVWNIRQSLSDAGHEKWLTRVMIRIGATASRIPCRIIYNAETSARRHEAIGYDRGRTAVIPNGFDTEEFFPDRALARRARSELGIAPDQPIVGLVARWHPVKDHGTFIRAAGLIAKARPDARFVLAGRNVDPANRELSGLIREAGLEGRIHALGDVADPARLTRTFDVACCSSISEAFPNVLGEALASGVPCVSTDVGDARSIIAEAGRIVPIRDPAAFARGCLDLLGLPDVERARLGQGARADIVARFSLDAVAAQYEDLYRSILGTERVNEEAEVHP